MTTREEFYVYTHTRPTTGQVFYVGKGKGKRAFRANGRNEHWKRIVAKDGGHDVHFLAQGLDEELSFLVEIESIDKFRKLGISLANATDGGEGPSGRVWSDAEKEVRRIRWQDPEVKAKQRAAKLGVTFSEERRAAMSARMKSDPRVQGRRFPTSRLGVKHTEESRTKMSASMKGRVANNKGKPMPAHVREILAHANAMRLRPSISEETKRKISEAQIGKFISSETRAKMSDARSRAVVCIDTGEVFKSALHAAKSCGVNYRTTVGECCQGKRPTAHGKRFKYLEEAAT